MTNQTVSEDVLMKRRALTEYVDIVLSMLSMPYEMRYGVDEAVKAAYHAYIARGGTNAEALAALRAARKVAR